DGIIIAPGRNTIIDPTGKIINVSGGNVRRFLPDGTVDTSLGVNGLSPLPVGPGTSMVFSYIQVDPVGKIILYGSASSSSSKWLLLARYNANGTLDTTFASDGMYERQTFDTCYPREFI